MPQTTTATPLTYHVQQEQEYQETTMGLFSTLLLQTTSSVTGTTSSINNDTSIIGSTSSITSINSTNTSSGSNIGNLPTVVQLYTKHPIPIFAVDTSVVASEDILNDLTQQQQQQQQQQKKAMMKKYSINHWFTTTSTSPTTTTTLSYTRATVSSFAPLQYYAVQCIPYQDYYGEKSLLGSILNTSSSAATSLDPSNPTSTSTSTTTNATANTTTTTIPSSSLRNTISSKQYQDLTMKYIHPDLGIYNCRCSSSSSSLSTSSSSSSLIDAMIPLTLQQQQSTGSNESISTSLSSMNLSNQVFCMVVDMTSSQQYVYVESYITTIQQALIRCLIQYSNLFTVNMNDKNKNNNSTTNYNTNTRMTSLEQLKLVQFGLANNDDSSKSSKTTTTTTNENDQNICITLQICVMMDRHHNQNSNINNSDNNNNNNNQDTVDSSSSSTSTTMNYHTQQLKQLLMYHLRKYAAALNASLVFVSTDMTSSTLSSSLVNDESGLAHQEQQQYQYQPTVNIRELPWVWKALANGIPVWNYDSIDAIETGRMIISNNVDTTTTEVSNIDKDNTIITETKSTDSTNNSNNLYSLIYGPDNHNTEWIESVLVRNANYVGHWDAMKDSIWKILIPPKSTTNMTNTMKTKEEMKINDGDQIWLQELYDSIVPVMTSSSTTTSTTTSNDATLQTPPPNKGSSSSTSSAVRPQSSMSKNKTATPNDAAVSSFFEDLLK